MVMISESLEEGSEFWDMNHIPWPSKGERFSVTFSRPEDVRNNPLGEKRSTRKIRSPPFNKRNLAREKKTKKEKEKANNERE